MPKIFSLRSDETFLFFLPQEFISCNKEIYSYARKKFLCREKKILAARKRMFCHYQENLS